MKSGFPYLVDISLTTKCPFGCNFCYTSSVAKGEDADYDFLVGNFRRALFDANVFDVVFGGGEPTLYPNVHEALKEFKKLKFVTGITTRNYELHKLDNAGEILSNCDSIAFSCTTLEDLRRIKICKDALGYAPLTTIYIQTIVGLTPFDDLLKLLRDCNENHFFNITLLGYKEFGFGTKQKSRPLPADWIEQLKKLELYRIGADSILINKYREELLAAGVKPEYLVGTEGESSCYVDLPRMRMQPSSFTDKFVPIEKQFNAERLLEIFSEF